MAVKLQMPTSSFLYEGVGIYSSMEPALFLVSLLAPMTFNQDPSTVALSPVTRYPLRVRVWSYNVAAGNPDISVPIPTMISASPDVSSMRWWSRTFNNNRGRGHTNNNLCESCRGNKSTSNYSDKREFFH